MRDGLNGVGRRVERDADVALRAQVVDLVGLNVEHQVGQVLSIGQVTVMQKQFRTGFVRIPVDVVDPHGVEAAAAADDPVNFVAFFQQQFCQIGTVLSGDPGNQCSFHNVLVRFCCRKSVGKNNRCLRGISLCQIAQFHGVKCHVHEVKGHTSAR